MLRAVAHNPKTNFERAQHDEEDDDEDLNPEIAVWKAKLAVLVQQERQRDHEEEGCEEDVVE